MIASLDIDGLALQRGERVLVAGFCARLQAGEAAALTGANGAGKTTLLRAIAGLVRPAAGAIAFRGPAGPLEADDARRRACHLVGHQDGLKGGRTAAEELDFQVRWSGGSRDAGRAAAARLGLGRQLGLPVRVLSAGQRRRLALARLIAASRALWLLDEPLAPLDAASRSLMGEVMAEHLAGGGLVLAAVHDPLPIRARVIELRSP